MIKKLVSAIIVSSAINLTKKEKYAISLKFLSYVFNPYNDYWIPILFKGLNSAEIGENRIAFSCFDRLFEGDFQGHLNESELFHLYCYFESRYGYNSKSEEIRKYIRSINYRDENVSGNIKRYTPLSENIEELLKK